MWTEAILFSKGVTHFLWCTLNSFLTVRSTTCLRDQKKEKTDNRPHQYEFNKLNLNYDVLMSKRPVDFGKGNT